MIHLIKHFVDNNHEEVLRRSLLHCHSPNLHSIMLLEKPGATIRMFYAEKEHLLWMNDDDSRNLSVAFHPHHCDVTLIRLCGNPYNRTASLSYYPDQKAVSLNRFRYQSKITHGEAGFIPEGTQTLYCDALYEIRATGTRMLAANIHTVVVPKNEEAAWLVLEGKEDPHYEPLCYSYAQPQVSDALYKPMTEAALQRIICRVGELVHESRKMRDVLQMI